MAVVATPVAARVRFTYLTPTLQPLSLGGINPTANAFQVSQLINALQIIQSEQVLDGFLTRETDLTEA